MSGARKLLCLALLALVVMDVLWFARHEPVALVVFALPPLLLFVACLAGKRWAGFWAGVLALLWFAHGVMVVWTRPDERGFAWSEIVLSLLVVGAASATGLAARFGRRAPASGDDVSEPPA